MRKIIFTITLVASMFVADINAQGLIVNKKSGEQVNTTYRALDNIATYLDASNNPGVIVTRKGGAQTTIPYGELVSIEPYAEVPLTGSEIGNGENVGWSNVTATIEGTHGAIPDYINIYKATRLQNKNCVAYIAVADVNKVKFNVLGDANSLNTPSTQYNSYKAPILMNGGYFYQNSLSLIMRNGQLICPNVQVDSPDWTKTYYYMPRGTFAQNYDGTIEVSWVYTQTEYWGGTTYSYPTSMPLENGRIPMADYPAGGKVFSAETAAGGGPVLLKNGVIYNTHSDEFLPVNVDSNRPRTALGYNPTTNRIVFFACAGDGILYVNGFTLADLCYIFQDLGCTEAVNLDGGGSTVMLINGKQVFAPANGTQRTVGSCVTLE